LPQLNLGITATGQFGINPQVNQERLIGDGIKQLANFFDYALPTNDNAIVRVSVAEPGQLRPTASGWEVVKKGKLELTDSVGNVFRPEIGEGAPALSPALAPVTPASMASPAPSQPFTREDLPAELLAKLGVSVGELERTGQLQKLLAGQKTDLISSFTLPGAQGQPVAFAAKLLLTRDAAGVATLRADLPKHQLEIPQQILGQEVTPAMKEELQTRGVVLAEGLQDGKGEHFPAYLAVDREMNRVVAVRRDAIALPPEVHGVTLNPQQRAQLLDGRPTPVVGLVNARNEVFDATLKLDAVKRQIVYENARLVPAPEPALRPRVR
jgi:hypothetical protein